MKKILLFFIILNTAVYGYNYKEVLIKAQIAIFPKILLLDKKLDEKLTGNNIVFIIAYEERDRMTAVNIQKLLSLRYGNFLSTHNFKTKIMEFSKISKDTEATAIYALNSETNINALSKICVSKGIVSFAYDINNLKNGLMFSLMLEKNAVLYLNKKSLNNNIINFVDSLYEIIKFTKLNKSN